MLGSFNVHFVCVILSLLFSCRSFYRSTFSIILLYGFLDEFPLLFIFKTFFVLVSSFYLEPPPPYCPTAPPQDLTQSQAHDVLSPNITSRRPRKVNAEHANVTTKSSAFPQPPCLYPRLSEVFPDVSVTDDSRDVGKSCAMERDPNASNCE